MGATLNGFNETLRMLLKMIDSYEISGVIPPHVADDLHDAVMDVEDYGYTIEAKEATDKAIDRLADTISKSNMVWSDRYWLWKSVLELKKNESD